MNPLIRLGAGTRPGTIKAALRAIWDEAPSRVPALGYTVPYAIGGFSLRGGTQGSPPPEDLLKLTPTRSLQDLVIALVALVHQRGSYPVTLGSRAGGFRSPRQMRGFLRWSVTERD
jgi:hypothetical protein